MSADIDQRRMVMLGEPSDNNILREEPHPLGSTDNVHELSNDPQEIVRAATSKIGNILRNQQVTDINGIKISGPLGPLIPENIGKQVMLHHSEGFDHHYGGRNDDAHQRAHTHEAAQNRGFFDIAGDALMTAGSSFVGGLEDVGKSFLSVADSDSGILSTTGEFFGKVVQAPFLGVHSVEHIVEGDPDIADFTPGIFTSAIEESNVILGGLGFRKLSDEEMHQAYKSAAIVASGLLIAAATGGALAPEVAAAGGAALEGVEAGLLLDGAATEVASVAPITLAELSAGGEVAAEVGELELAEGAAVSEGTESMALVEVGEQEAGTSEAQGAINFAKQKRPGINVAEITDEIGKRINNAPDDDTKKQLIELRSNWNAIAVRDEQIQTIRAQIGEMRNQMSLQAQLVEEHAARLGYVSENVGRARALADEVTVAWSPYVRESASMIDQLPQVAGVVQAFTSPNISKALVTYDDHIHHQTVQQIHGVVHGNEVLDYKDIYYDADEVQFFDASEHLQQIDENVEQVTISNQDALDEITSIPLHSVFSLNSGISSAMNAMTYILAGSLVYGMAAYNYPMSTAALTVGVPSAVGIHYYRKFKGWLHSNKLFGIARAGARFLGHNKLSEHVPQAKFFMKSHHTNAMSDDVANSLLGNPSLMPEISYEVTDE